jgi:hypothetical protein
LNIISELLGVLAMNTLLIVVELVFAGGVGCVFTISRLYQRYDQLASFSLRLPIVWLLFVVNVTFCMGLVFVFIKQQNDGYVQLASFPLSTALSKVMSLLVVPSKKFKWLGWISGVCNMWIDRPVAQKKTEVIMKIRQCLKEQQEQQVLKDFGFAFLKSFEVAEDEKSHKEQFEAFKIAANENNNMEMIIILCETCNPFWLLSQIQLNEKALKRRR